MNLDYLTEDQQLCFPMVRGCIGIERKEKEKRFRLTRQMAIAPLGHIHLPSGKMIVGDAFQGLLSSGNYWFSTPVGVFPVFKSFSFQKREDNGKTKVRNIKTNYLTVVFNMSKMEARMKEDLENIPSGLPPLLNSVLIQAAPSIPSELYSEGEIEALSKSPIYIQTGNVLISDKNNFENLMPLTITGSEWLENVFDYDNQDSWFEAVDSDTPWPKGSSNHTLPNGDENQNLIICPGKSGGNIKVFEEADKEDEIFALHIEINPS